MKTIYKYRLNNPALGKFNIELPKNSTITGCGVDCDGVPCFWAFVDTDQSLEEHTFFLTGTGWDIDDFLEKYSKTGLVACLGIIKEPPYIWHLFMELEREEEEC